MLHPILQRQLRRLGLGADKLPTRAEDWSSLLDRISKAYTNADNDRYTLERSSAISSREMQQLYETLRANEVVLQLERDRLQAVVAAVGDGLCILDPDGRARFANAAALRLLGVSATLLPDLPLLQRFCTFAAGSPDIASMTQEVRIEDGVLRRYDECQLPISYVLTPIIANTESSGAVLVFRDISKTKLEQSTLRQSLDLAEAASRAKSEFLAVMSHELRTPVSGVIGLTHLLLSLDLAADARGYAEAIEQSGKSLLAVISDILDLSKIEAGRLVVEQTSFRPLEPIEQALAVVALPAQEKGVELAALVDPELPQVLRGDSGRLRQILLNLLGNAVKFTERGSVTLHVRVLDHTADAVELEFAVADTGIGIPESARQRLFQAFSQVDSSMARRYGGTGLGLAISRRLARSMDGDITFTSEEGKGSTFTLNVKLATAEGTPPAKPLQGMRVLAVCSQPLTLAAIELTARNAGATVQTANSVAAARTLLAEIASDRQTIHAVLVDRELVDGDGLDLLGRLAHDPIADSVCRVCVAGWPERPSNLELDRHGVHRLVGKPVRQDDLVRALRTLVDGGTATTPQPTGSPQPRTAIRVLIAEDNPIGQMVAQRMLEHRGCTTTVVADGRAAIAACDSGQFDLVLMDCQMPTCDGFTATQAIRSLPGLSRQVPIVALTANALEGDRERCLAAGMDDYLAKPLTPKALDAMLHRWLPRT